MSGDPAFPTLPTSPTLPTLPTDETERLAALERSRILDTQADDAFEDLIRIAAAICRVPMAMVTLVGADRQWLKARLGIPVRETGRDESFCAHTILEPGAPLVVEDARQDPRFRDNPFVTGESAVRFYAGAPLLDADGFALGSFCVMDRVPRKLEPAQLEALQALSRQASRLIEAHRLALELRYHLEEREWYERQLRLHHQQLERQNAALTELTRTDPLTGLPNRRAFTVALEEVAESGGRYCVAVCDIDHFKAVNDAHGHAEGDRVLQAVADTLRDQLAARGRVARAGGEEFVLLFPDCGLDEAVRQCESLREAIASRQEAHRVTVSIGVAEGGPEGGPEEAFARADAAVYAAKNSGRNRVVAG